MEYAISADQFTLLTRSKSALTVFRSSDQVGHDLDIVILSQLTRLIPIWQMLISLRHRDFPRFQNRLQRPNVLPHYLWKARQAPPSY